MLLINIQLHMFLYSINPLWTLYLPPCYHTHTPVYAYVPSRCGWGRSPWLGWDLGSSTSALQTMKLRKLGPLCCDSKCADADTRGTCRRSSAFTISTFSSNPSQPLPKKWKERAAEANVAWNCQTNFHLFLILCLSAFSRRTEPIELICHVRWYLLGGL